MNSRKLKILVLPLFLATVLFGVVVYLQTIPLVPSPKGGSPVADVERSVTLYFVAPDGHHLVGETRRVAPCNDAASCQLATVRALLAGPTAPLLPLFPRGGSVSSVVVLDSGAQVDLAPETLTGHPGGSLAEWLTLMGLVDTLAVNFPTIRQVSVLVNGAPRESLRGHVDLLNPVVPDYSLIQTTSTTPVVPQTSGR